MRVLNNYQSQLSTLGFIIPVSVAIGSLRRKKKSSEAALIEGLVCGDHKVLEEIYDSYSASLYGVILRIVKREENAEDVLQETFIKVWKCCTQYDPSRGRLYTWLLNIARHVAFDHIKSKSYKNNSKLEDIEDLTLIVDSQKNTINNPEIIGVRHMASNLKDDYRSILDLVYFQGYTHSEAAEELGIPIGTLKTRIRAAVLSLRAKFNK